MDGSSSSQQPQRSQKYEDAEVQQKPEGSQKSEDAAAQLNRVVHKSTEVLMQAKTVLPFNRLTPVVLAIDREKVTITYRFFFSTLEVISIRIDDVVGVVATAGPFFGSLKIFNRHHSPEEPNVINYLRRRDALKAKRMLEGHIIASQRDIDLSTLPKEELITKLMDLGAGTPDENV